MGKLAWIAVSLLLFAQPASAEVKRTAGTREGKPYLELSNLRVMTGTIIAIDMTTREVKLLNEANDTLSVVAGPEVKNLSKVHVKDVVKLSIKEQTTIETATGPAAKDSKEVSVTSAQPGEEPHGTVTTESRSTADIIAIDMATSTVTLKRQDGNTFTAKAKRKDTLDKIKVGEQVVFSSTKTVTISVVKTAAK
jgi:hypothetical protein